MPLFSSYCMPDNPAVLRTHVQLLEAFVSFHGDLVFPLV